MLEPRRQRLEVRRPVDPAVVERGPLHARPALACDERTRPVKNGGSRYASVTRPAWVFARARKATRLSPWISSPAPSRAAGGAARRRRLRERERYGRSLSFPPSAASRCVLDPHANRAGRVDSRCQLRRSGPLIDSAHVVELQPEEDRATTARSTASRYSSREISMQPSDSRCGFMDLRRRTARTRSPRSAAHERRERDLRRVRAAMEHRLAGEEAPDGDAVDPADELRTVPPRPRPRRCEPIRARAGGRSPRRTAE